MTRYSRCFHVYFHVYFYYFCVYLLILTTDSPNHSNITNSAAVPRLGGSGFAMYRDLIRLASTMTTNGKDKLIALVGIDAYLLLKFVSKCGKIFGLLSVLGLFVVLPVNVLSGRADNEEEWEERWREFPSWQDKLSLSALTPAMMAYGSSWFWVHIVALWIVTGFVIHSLVSLYRDVIDARTRFATRQDELSSRALIFTGLPPSLQKDTAFETYLKQSVSVPISTSSIGRDLTELATKFDKYNQDILKLESVLTSYLTKIDKSDKPVPRPTHREPMLIGRKQDTISTLTHELSTLEVEVYKGRLSAHHAKTNACGFAVFDSAKDAITALHELKNMKTLALGKPLPHVCPPIKDLRWENAGLNSHTRKIRFLITLGIFLAIIFGWSVFSAWVMLMSKLDSIQSFAPDVADWVRSQSVFNFIFTVILPPVLFAVLGIVLILILRKVVQLQGLISINKEERRVLSILFGFNIWNIIVLNGAGILLVKGKALLRGESNDSAGDVLQDAAVSFVGVCHHQFQAQILQKSFV